MTQKEFLKALADSYARNVEISRAKNADYAGSSDPFLNFRLIETLSKGKITTEQGILVRMSDKLQRITNLLYSGARVKDEKITDTLADLANYAMILKIYLESISPKR